MREVMVLNEAKMIMKKYRITSALLLLALLMSASCGNGGSGDNITVTDDTGADITTEPEYDYLDELGENKFGGRTFKLLDANDYPKSRNLPDEEMNGDIINDALYQRTLDIEQLLDIRIEYIRETPASDGTTKLKNSVLAGDHDYDLCFSTILGGTLGTIANDGVLANLCDVPGLSLNEKWWSGLLYDSLRINGNMYFTTGDISPILYVSPAALFVNVRAMEDYSIKDDIYSLVLDGKWTVDKVASMVMQYNNDLDGDGIMHTGTDFFGYVCAPITLTSNALLVGAGIDLSSNSGDGISVDLANENVVNTVEKLRTLITDMKFDHADDIVNKAFVQGRTIICQHFLGTAQLDNVRNMDNDFIVAPLAKYDESQENYRSLLNAWNACYIGIPTNADLDFVGTVTEALAYYSYKNIRPKCYELFLKEKMMRNEESTKMVDIIFESAYIDFNALYDFGGVCGKLENAIFKGDDSLISTITSLQPSIDSAVEKLIEAWQ